MQAQEYVRPIDPTAGLELVSAVGRSREETRYLFMAGSDLDADHVLQRDWMTQWNSQGGTEIETNCFRRTIHGFLPRATLIPLEVWTKGYPIQFISEGSEENTVKIVSSITPEAAGISPTKPTSIVSNLAQANQNVKFFPGDEIARILRNNADRGVVEVPALQGMEWYDGDKPGQAQVLNADFFPERPIVLSRIEELIHKAAGRSALHGKVAEPARISCQKFRRWAQTTLAAKHVLFRSTNTQNFPYVYSGTERVLLAQLEMQPQDVANSDAMMRIMDKLASQGVNENAQGASPELIGQIAAAVVKELAGKRGPGRPPKESAE